MAYDDLYNFVPLRKGMSNAKVCTDDKSLCCLAEFVADLTDTTVFSLGIFLYSILFIIHIQFVLFKVFSRVTISKMEVLQDNLGDTHCILFSRLRLIF